MNDAHQHDSPYAREPFDYRPWREFYELLSGAGVVAALVIAGVLIFASDLPAYWQNLYITGVGVALTVGILDRRAEHRATQQRKDELILQMGSPDNAFAIEAVRLLRSKGWLEDGSLKYAKLAGANLQHAFLMKADLEAAILAGSKLSSSHLHKANLQRAFLLDVDLQAANLPGANLQQADLRKANLTGTYLTGADLQEACLAHSKMHSTNLEGGNLRCAILSSANLQRASLVDTRLCEALVAHTNLQEANLERADLSGANLTGANLQGANLTNTTFSPQTILPDGTHWSPDSDMRRFTDPNHPSVWRSDEPGRSAFWG